MRLHVYVKGKLVAHLYRQADDYALRYTADALDADFASLTMPVREDAWIWPRDLHPFFRQNLPEGFLFQVIREEFGPYLDGTDLSLLAVIGGAGLLGLPPHEKYRPSTEQVLNATKPYIGPANWRREAEQLGWQLITNYVVRNADCHAKNIALLYSNIDDVIYTPAYDIVTTEAYARFANNPPGLSIDGRKTWAPGKTLERFFNTRLGIPPKQYREMVEALCDSAVSTGKDIVEAARNETRWHWTAKQMLHAWNEGMGSLRSAKPQVAFKALTPVIEAAGFSDADQAGNAKAIIGRSELLANHDKKP